MQIWVANPNMFGARASLVMRVQNENSSDMPILVFDPLRILKTILRLVPKGVHHAIAKLLLAIAVDYSALILSVACNRDI